MVRQLVLLFIIALTSVSTVWAQDFPFRDEAASDPSFVAFRKELRQAVRQHDSDVMRITRIRLFERQPISGIECIAARWNFIRLTVRFRDSTPVNEVHRRCIAHSRRKRLRVRVGDAMHDLSKQPFLFGPSLLQRGTGHFVFTMTSVDFPSRFNRRASRLLARNLLPPGLGTLLASSARPCYSRPIPQSNDAPRARGSLICRGPPSPARSDVSSPLHSGSKVRQRGVIPLRISGLMCLA